MDARGIPGDYDLIFSNSCIQWIDDHDTLIPWHRILAGCSDSFEMWTTTYYHALKSHVELVEWKSGTHLRPYLDALDESEGNRLKNEILQRLEVAYKPASDGRILMRYERFFFTASR